VAEEGPYSLLIAAFDDQAAAGEALDVLRAWDQAGAVKIEGAAVVSRDLDGKIHVVERPDHRTAKGVGWGAVAGVAFGLIFPPSILAGAVVGAVGGGVVGKLVDRHDKKEIKEDIEADLPPGTSGIVALLEDRWVAEAREALTQSTKVDAKQLDDDGAKAVKEAAAKAGS